MALYYDAYVQTALYQNYDCRALALLRPLRLTRLGPWTTSISPSVWNAAGVTSSSIVRIPNDTSIDASVTLDGSAPPGNGTVTAQSNGYGGRGFSKHNPVRPPRERECPTIQGRRGLSSN